jgi:hypothetical protein
MGGLQGAAETGAAKRERERREVFTGAAGAAAIPLERAHLLSHVRALVRRTCVAVARFCSTTEVLIRDENGRKPSVKG